MSMTVLLTKMNSLNAYSKKAEDYASFRLDYASEAFQALFDISGLDSNWIVADIGSGTGNVSKHLVAHVSKIFAVEPNAAMREQAEFSLNRFSSFKSIGGKAEKTLIPDNSVNMIIVGQAFHWFDHDASKNEFYRILKPEGWLSIIWNEFGNGQDLKLESYFLNADFKHFAFPQTIRETWQEYIGGVRSTAAAPNQDEDEYKSFEREHRRVFNSQALNGLIEVKFNTKLIVGRLDSRTNHLR